METKEKVNCKKFKKNKDPKCNDQPECNWEKGKGCLPKLIVRTQQEIITNEPETREEITEQNKEKNKFLIKNESELENALEDFYKLKSKYENELSKKKYKIYNNDNLTKKEKKQEIRKIKKTCIQCKKQGGTIFSLKNRTLKAVCGASEPCNLNIEIKLGVYVQKKHLIHELKRNILQIKENIIITKLNILFRLENEEVMLEEFNKLKKEYQKQEKQLLELHRYIEEKLNIANKKVLLKNAKEFLQKELNNFNELIKNAKIEKQKNNISISKALLREAIEKYKDEITQLQQNIRNIENEYIFINNSQEFNVNIYNTIELLKEKYKLEDTEIEVEPSQVISYKK